MIYLKQIRDYPSSYLVYSKFLFFRLSQIAIWDIPSCDLGYPKLRFGTKFDLGYNDLPNRNVDLGYPKSECRFGISQIAIWIWATTYPPSYFLEDQFYHFMKHRHYLILPLFEHCLMDDLDDESYTISFKNKTGGL